MAKYNIKPVFDEKIATHIKGNQLDQIWSNMPLSGQAQVVKSAKNQFDHFALSVKFYAEAKSG